MVGLLNVRFVPFITNISRRLTASRPKIDIHLVLSWIKDRVFFNIGFTSIHEIHTSSSRDFFAILLASMFLIPLIFAPS